MACGSTYKLRPGACPHTGIRYYCRLGNAILQDLCPACCISFDRHSRALCKYNAPAAVDSCACVHTNQNIPFVCVANKYCCKKQKRGRTGLTTSLSNCRIILLLCGTRLGSTDDVLYYCSMNNSEGLDAFRELFRVRTRVGWS